MVLFFSKSNLKILKTHRMLLLSPKNLCLNSFYKLNLKGHLSVQKNYVLKEASSYPEIIPNTFV